MPFCRPKYRLGFLCIDQPMQCPFLNFLKPWMTILSSFLPYSLQLYTLFGKLSQCSDDFEENWQEIWCN